MKKFLLSLLIVAVGAVASYADSYTIMFNTTDAKDGSSTSLTTSDAVSNTVTTASAEYVTGNFISTEKAYKNSVNGIKLGSSSASGYIEFALSEKGKVNASKIGLDIYRYNSTKDANAFLELYVNGDIVAVFSNLATTSNSVEYVFDSSTTIETLMVKSGSTGTTSSNKAPRVYIREITVTYAAGSVTPVEVVAPVIEVSEDYVVSMSCETDGATIYYTLDGSEPTAESAVYSTPFPLTQSCTIKALAVKGDEFSSISSKEVTVPVIYDSLRALLSAGKDDAVSVKADMSVLYKSGAYLYLTDGVSNMLIYDYELPKSCEVAEAISAFTGIVDVYNGLFEIKNPTITKGGNGAGYTPAAVNDLSAISADGNLFDLVTLSGASISKTGSDTRQYTITLADNSVTLWNTFGIDITEGENYDVTAFVSVNNGTLQLLPTEVTQNGPVVLGEIKVNGQEVSDDDVITITLGESIGISCANADTIMYETDGEDEADISEGESITWTPVQEGEYIVDVTASLGEESKNVIFSVKVEAAPVITSGTETFDFNSGQRAVYGFDPKNSNSKPAYELEVKRIEEGIVAIDFTGNYRLWANDWTLRIYKEATITVSVPDNYYITQIEFTDKTAGMSASEGNFDSGKWTANVDAENSSVQFNFSATVNIKTIAVSFDKKSPEIKGITFNDPVEDNTTGDVTVYYVLHVMNHAEKNNYTVQLVLKDDDGKEVTDAVTVTEHSTFSGDFTFAPRRVAGHDMLGGATDRMQGVATFSGIATGTALGAVSVKHAINDNNLSDEQVVKFDAPITTGIVELDAAAAEAEAEWFDLSGRRVAEPARGGIYLRRQGGAVSKCAL